MWEWGWFLRWHVKGEDGGWKFQQPLTWDELEARESPGFDWEEIIANMDKKIPQQHRDHEEWVKSWPSGEYLEERVMRFFQVLQQWWEMMKEGTYLDEHPSLTCDITPEHAADVIERVKRQVAAKTPVGWGKIFTPPYEQLPVEQQLALVEDLREALVTQSGDAESDEKRHEVYEERSMVDPTHRIHPGHVFNTYGMVAEDLDTP